MSKKAKRIGAKMVGLLEQTIKKPFLDALAIFGFVKILSIVVDRDFIPHIHYIILLISICLYSSITSHEKKQVYTSAVSIVSFCLFLILKPYDTPKWSMTVLEITFLVCFIYNLVFYIRRMFNFTSVKSKLPIFSFLIMYFTFIFLQPIVSIEEIQKPIINFSKIELKNFISINYQDEYQFDLIYTIWNVLTLLITGHSIKGASKTRNRK